MAQTITTPQARFVIRDKEFTEAMKKKFARRVALAAEKVKNQVVLNISEPTRELGPSKEGEFPHADTGRLRNSIFWRMQGELEAIVGTNLFYGLVLEYSRNRSFLRRTMWEMRDEIIKILTLGGTSGSVGFNDIGIG